jgi:hypothetical protein
MSQPEMRSDRLRAELAEVKRQRDLLREALGNIMNIGWDSIIGYPPYGGREFIDWNDPDTQPILDRIVQLLPAARAALEATEAKS